MNSGELIEKLTRTGEDHEVYMSTGSTSSGYAKFSGFVNTRLKDVGSDIAKPAIILMSEQEMAQSVNALESFGGLVFANQDLYQQIKETLGTSLSYHFGASGKAMAESIMEDLFATEYNQTNREDLPF